MTLGMSLSMNAQVIIKCLAKAYGEKFSFYEVPDDVECPTNEPTPATLMSFNNNQYRGALWGKKAFTFFYNDRVVKFSQSLPWVKVKKLIDTTQDLNGICKICTDYEPVQIGCPACYKTICLTCIENIGDPKGDHTTYKCPYCRGECRLMTTGDDGGAKIIVYYGNNDL